MSRHVENQRVRSRRVRPIPLPAAARAALLALFCSTAWTVPTHARVWRVEKDGSGDFASIQQAINASTSGDEIQVGPGKYIERLYYGSRAVAVRSTQGPEMTIIDADSTGSVVTLNLGEGAGSILDGFTLRGGTGTRLDLLPDKGAEERSSRAGEEARGPGPRQFRYGGGILLIGSGPTLRNLIVTGNGADYGGGLCGLGADPIVQDCKFLHNLAGWGAGTALFDQSHLSFFTRCEWSDNRAAVGGGLALLFSPAALRHCEFVRNSSGDGGGLFVRGDPTSTVVEQTVFWANQSGEGSAVRTFEASLTIRSCTIAGNGLAGEDPATLYFTNSSRVEVTQSILAGNTSAAAVSCPGSTVEMRCNDLWSPTDSPKGCGPGEDSFSADPRFCGAKRGDFTLREDSPCLPGVAPFECGLIGAEGAACPPPAVEVPTRGGPEALSPDPPRGNGRIP